MIFKKIYAKITAAIAAIAAIFISIFINEVKEVIKPIVKETMNELIITGKESLGTSEYKSFEQASLECQTEISTNSKIDLNDSVAVYDAIINCLLVQKNQGNALDKIAEEDNELKQTLAEIRQKLSQ